MLPIRRRKIRRCILLLRIVLVVVVISIIVPSIIQIWIWIWIWILILLRKFLLYEHSSEARCRQRRCDEQDTIRELLDLSLLLEHVHRRIFFVRDCVLVWWSQVERLLRLTFTSASASASATSSLMKLSSPSPPPFSCDFSASSIAPEAMALYY